MATHNEEQDSKVFAASGAVSDAGTSTDPSTSVGRGGGKTVHKQARLNINLNPATAKALRDMAREKATTVTEVVRRAVSVYKFFEDEIRAGRKIQTMDVDGSNKHDVVLM